MKRIDLSRSIFFPISLYFYFSVLLRLPYSPVHKMGDREKIHPNGNRRQGKELMHSGVVTPTLPKRANLKSPKLWAVEEPDERYEWVWESGPRRLRKLPQTPSNSEDNSSCDSYKTPDICACGDKCPQSRHLVASIKRLKAALDASEERVRKAVAEEMNLRVANNVLVERVSEVTTGYCVLGVHNLADKAMIKKLKLLLVVSTCIVVVSLLAHFK